MENTVNLINSAETCIGIFTDGRYSDKVIMSVETVARKIKTGNMIFPQETFQTEWSDRAGSNLIMAILKGYPIRRIYTKFEENNIYIINGQTRVKVINDFINNKFKLNPNNPCISCEFKDTTGERVVKDYDVSNKYFKDLPEALQNAILWYNLDIVEMCGYTDDELNYIGG